MGPKERKEVNPFLIGGVAIGIIAAVLLVVGLMQLLRRNPYGAETRIDNIGEVYSNLSQDAKDQIFYQLHMVLEANLGDNSKVPESGAMVRKETAEYDYDEETKVYAGKFVTDVSAVEQSYLVQFSWSPVAKNENLGGYPVLITCVPKDLRIYESQQACVDFNTEEVSWQNAYQIDYTFGARTSQKMRAAIGQVFLNEVEAESYLAVVDEASLSKVRTEPNFTYRFNIVLDGVTYAVVARTDAMYGDEYIAVYINGEGLARGLVLTSDESFRTEMAEWLRRISGNAGLEVELQEL